MSQADDALSQRGKEAHVAMLEGFLPHPLNPLRILTWPPCLPGAHTCTYISPAVAVYDYSLSHSPGSL